MLLNELTNCVYYHGYKNKDIFKTANTKIKKKYDFFRFKKFSVSFVHCKKIPILAL